MTNLIHAVMCGGAGTRLWPWSRKSFPKQFIALLDDVSLLQATVDRLDGLSANISTIAFASEEHRFLIAEQLSSTKLGYDEIVLEPEGRNTAPVAVMAALKALDRAGSDALVLLAPSDHHIADATLYKATIEKALPIARSGRIVTFGIAPEHPSTAFGYIRPGPELPEYEAFREISRFTEKPDAQTAAAFLEEGYLWNTGIFLFAPEALLEIASICRPDMVERCRQAYGKGSRDGDFYRLDAESFSGLAAESFDRAVMENIGRHGAVTQFAGGWTDVGSWETVRARAVDGFAGLTEGQGSVETFDCTGVLGLSDGPLVVAHGLEDTIIVADTDAVYVASAGASAGLSNIVPELERRGLSQASAHLHVYRPWGCYKRIRIGEGYEVREIVVKPGGQLSLQMHNHRSEHWVVVRGVARVTIGDEVRLLRENESVYVPVKTKHRLENPGETPMHLIEVQTGSHLSEDDIVRFEDRYGRLNGR